MKARPAAIRGTVRIDVTGDEYELLQWWRRQPRSAMTDWLRFTRDWDDAARDADPLENPESSFGS